MRERRLTMREKDSGRYPTFILSEESSKNWSERERERVRDRESVRDREIDRESERQRER